MSKRWSDQEKRHISEHYPAIGTRNLTRLLVGRSEKAIYVMANKLGLMKTHDRLREQGSENVRRRWDRVFADQEPPVQ